MKTWSHLIEGLTDSLCPLTLSRMKTRQLGILKSLWVLTVGAASGFPASAHFVYGTGGEAAHNLEHLAPSLSLLVLLLALGATAVYCFKRK